MRVTVAVFLAGALSVAFCDVLNNRPIVGILTVPIEHSDCITARNSQSTSSSPTSCFHSLYVKWLESAGARVVPIPFDLPRSKLATLFTSLNGVLFTGGETVITDLASPFMTTAALLLQWTIEANNNGEHIPLWGTCMGFQVLSVLTARNSSVLSTNEYASEGLMLPLTLTPNAPASKMFSAMPEQYLTILTYENATVNLHHDGVNPSEFTTNPSLANFFTVLSTNVDMNGRPFVSSIEGRSHPVYGVQFHPERPAYDWSESPVNDPIGHSGDIILANNWLASFYVSETRRNSRAFSSTEAEAKALIYNYVPSGHNSYQAYLIGPDNWPIL